MSALQRFCARTFATPSPCFVPKMAVVLFAVAACFSSWAAAADPIRGGLLYDKWWVVNGAAEPAGDHPLYPASGQKSGSTTFRCKECHGWDYKGADGAYGAGSSHFTGIPGVFGSSLSAAELFDIIKNPSGDGTGGTTVNGHDFGNLGLAAGDIDDLVEFLLTLLIDTDDFIDGDGAFIGDEVQGQEDYTGAGECTLCHGPDGTAINFGTPKDPAWVGTIALDNPWEFMHKIRMGQPGSIMPSWTDEEGSDSGVANIGLYAQLNFPAALGCDGVPGSGLEFDECGVCGGDGSKCAGVCGDGVVQTGEQCDDGNLANDDGCSSTCQIEGVAVPTLSGWGLTILAVVLLMLVMRRSILNDRRCRSS